MAALKMPDGFTAHTGGKCPVDADRFVEVLIRTAEGFGASEIQRASMHEWDAKGLGEIVGYRVAALGESPTFDPKAREKVVSHLKPVKS